MNDEIKKILFDMDLIVNHNKVPIYFTQNKVKLLLDYITNLQQENERLKNELIKLSQMISELNMFLNDRLEEFKNSGKSRKNIKAHHYYMLINAIKDLLVED